MPDVDFSQPSSRKWDRSVMMPRAADKPADYATAIEQMSYMFDNEGTYAILIRALIEEMLAQGHLEYMDEEIGYLKRFLPQYFSSLPEPGIRRDRWGEIITPEQQAEMDAEDFLWRDRPNPDYPYPPLGGPMPARFKKGEYKGMKGRSVYKGKLMSNVAIARAKAAGNGGRAPEKEGWRTGKSVYKGKLMSNEAVMEAQNMAPELYWDRENHRWV